MIDVLNIVIILNLLNKLFVFYPLVFRQFLQVNGRYSLKSAAYDSVTFLLYIFLYVTERLVGAVDYNGFVAVLIFLAEDLVRSIIYEFEFQFVKVNLFFLALDLEDALVVEHELNASACAEGAVVLVEVAADVGNRTGMVVSRGLYKICYTAWTITFIHYFLEITLVLFNSSLDSPVNVLLRHVLTLSRLDDCSQGRVIVRIRTAVLGCYGNFLSQTCEDAGHVAPSFELSFFSEFKCSSHRELFYRCFRSGYVFLDLHSLR